MHGFFILLGLFLLLAISSISYAVKCADFQTHQQAQAYFNAKKPNYKRLDRDGDGSACDCLPGGSGTKCPKRKKR